MTSIEWLLSELEKVNYHPTEAMIMYAKKLHKQEIMNTYIIADSESTIEDSEHNALKFYERNYVNKGSDDAQLPQQEISDEEIEKFADEELGTIRTDFDFGVIQGMKWYREQLKKL